jgi:hypothetical protein
MGTREQGAGAKEGLTKLGRRVLKSRSWPPLACARRDRRPPHGFRRVRRRAILRGASRGHHQAVDRRGPVLAAARTSRVIPPKQVAIA